MALQSEKLKILSWNINGIRSSKTPVKTILDSLDADIICFQETKITRDQVDESTAIVEGYNAYFSFSRKRSGYSGVATYCKDSTTPVAAEEGLSSHFGANYIGCYGDETQFTADELADLDSEGRAVLTKHTIRKDGRHFDLVVFNVYCPRFDCTRPERMDYKLQFYKLLQLRAEAILKSGSHVIIVGDINCSHKPMDHCDPTNLEEFSSNPGRIWLDQFLQHQTTVPPSPEDGKFVDTFRHFHPDEENAFTCWSTVTNARQTNYGTRIDYIFADHHLLSTCFTDSSILPDIEGSDHCPVAATLSCTAIPSAKIPQLCAKFWPEFAGKQQKLLRYLSVNSECTSRPPSSTQSESNNCKKGQKRKSCDANGSTQKSIMGYFQGKNNVKCLDEEHKKDVEVVVVPEVPEVEHVPKESSSSVNAWKSLLKGPDPPPLCKKHNEPCVLRVVKKQGPNLRRKFYVCARGEGHSTNPEARCDFFQWVKATNPK